MCSRRSCGNRGGGFAMARFNHDGDLLEASDIDFFEESY
jgi:hypothetical protein